MTDENTYECSVCGRESDSQWAITKCEFRHTVNKWSQKLGLG